MTTLSAEQLGFTPGSRSSRALERARRRAEDELGDRTVWCATELPVANVAVEVFGAGVPDAEAVVGDRVHRDDVVVLRDPLTVALAQSIRDSGAHAIWYLGAADSPLDPAAASTLAFLQDTTSGVDAFVGTWVEPVGRGLRIERIAALVPSADVMAARDVPAGREDVGWSSLLAEVVHSDRGETVGGLLHPRPTVAMR